MTEENPVISADDAKGFVGMLMDFSFSDFITPKIIKVLYIIGIVLAGLVALGILASFVMAGGASILIGIIAAPVAFILYVIFARVWLEITLVLFRIEQNTRKG